MQIFLLGKNGQLGWELQRTLATLADLITLDFPEIDLTRPELVCEMIRKIRPALIINATAYTQVDKAEGELELAMAINGVAPGRLAETASGIGAALIHYSTDYVFDGKKGSPYTEYDPVNPINAYGRTKLAGDQAVASLARSYWIFRTSWVFSLRRDSYVTKVLSWAREQSVLRIVDDQVGSPTWCRSLAEITAQLIARAGETPQDWIAERRGLYHLAGDGAASRFELAKEILRLDPRSDEQVCTEILPASTHDFPAPAQRPLYTALNCDLFKDTFGLCLPAWQRALRLAMEVPQ